VQEGAVEDRAAAGANRARSAGLASGARMAVAPDPVGGAFGTRFFGIYSKRFQYMHQFNTILSGKINLSATLFE
jgi:hypothetical protein